MMRKRPITTLLRPAKHYTLILLRVPARMIMLMLARGRDIVFPCRAYLPKGRELKAPKGSDRATLGLVLVRPRWQPTWLSKRFRRISKCNFCVGSHRISHRISFCSLLTRGVANRYVLWEKNLKSLQILARANFLINIVARRTIFIYIINFHIITWQNPRVRGYIFTLIHPMYVRYDIEHFTCGLHPNFRYEGNEQFQRISYLYAAQSIY